jgi:hypothetical protein
LLVKGVVQEKMRKHGKSLESLKIEDTIQKKGGGGNKHVPASNPDGASRLLIKGAVRRDGQKSKLHEGGDP